MPHSHFITPADSQADFARETAEHVVKCHLALAQTADNLAPNCSAKGAHPWPDRFPALGRGPPERGWRPTWFGQVPPSTAIVPRASNPKNGVARTNTQVRVQVADTNDFVVGVRGTEFSSIGRILRLPVLEDKTLLLPTLLVF